MTQKPQPMKKSCFYAEKRTPKAMADRNNIVIEKEGNNSERITVTIQGNQT